MGSDIFSIFILRSQWSIRGIVFTSFVSQHFHNKRCLTVEFSGVKILYSGSKLEELRL